MKRTVRFLINLILGAAVPYAWITMVLGVDGLFASTGLHSLKYYTVLSNWLVALGAWAYIIFAIWRRRKDRRRGKLWATREINIPHGLAVFKYVSAVCVMITFLTVVVFLGPMFGYPYMFLGPNLWLHLIVPLLALFEVLFFREGPEDFSLRDDVFCVVPTIIYGIGYLGNIYLNGMGEGYETNDWYGFLLWGWPVAAGIFVFICLIAFLIGLILRKVPHGT